MNLIKMDPIIPQPQEQAPMSTPEVHPLKKEIGTKGLMITSLVFGVGSFALPVIFEAIMLPIAFLFAILALIQSIKIKKKSFIIGSVVALVLPFAVFGVTYLSFYIQKQAVLKQISFGQEGITPTPTATDLIDTSTWKTYTNTQYEFEFKYPGNWRVGNFSNGMDLDLCPTGVFFEDCLRVVKWPSDIKTTLSQTRINDVAYNTILIKREKLISGINWTEYKIKQMGSAREDWIYFTENNNIAYSVGGNPLQEQIIDQILSTFKFTK